MFEVLKHLGLSTFVPCFVQIKLDHSKHDCSIIFKDIIMYHFHSEQLLRIKQPNSTYQLLTPGANLVQIKPLPEHTVGKKTEKKKIGLGSG